MNTTKLRDASVLFLIQLVSYAVICVNTRAIAAVDYPTALWSDLLIASLNFYIFRRITREAEAMHLFAGYVIGSLAGTVAGIYISTQVTA